MADYAQVGALGDFLVTLDRSRSHEKGFMPLDLGKCVSKVTRFEHLAVEHFEHSSSASLGLADYTQVDVVGVWYKYGRAVQLVLGVLYNSSRCSWRVVQLKSTFWVCGTYHFELRRSTLRWSILKQTH